MKILKYLVIIWKILLIPIKVIWLYLVLFSRAILLLVRLPFMYLWSVFNYYIYDFRIKAHMDREQRSRYNKMKPSLKAFFGSAFIRNNEVAKRK
ncbi:MAG: hypothetical protein ACYS1A_17110 [Planctomycetota bacterium]|jgi:hypothetical protein